MILRSMRKCLGVTAGVLAAAGVWVAFSVGGDALGSAGAEISAEAKVLVQLDDDWSAAAATRDAHRVVAFYADDAVVYPPNEPMMVGREAAEKVWAAYFADPSYNLSWKTTYAEVHGPLGYTAGTYEDSFEGSDGETVAGGGKYLCVWKKQDDGTWKAVHDMWNADSPY